MISTAMARFSATETPLGNITMNVNDAKMSSTGMKYRATTSAKASVSGFADSSASDSKRRSVLSSTVATARTVIAAPQLIAPASSASPDA